MFTRITLAGAAVLALAITVFSSGDVLAGKGGNGGGGGSSIWIEGGDFAATADGQTRVGQELTFGFTTNYWDTDGGTGPWLQMQCFRAGADYQYEGQLSGVLILSESRAGFPGGWGYGVPFELSGTSWTTGPADCTGILGHKSKSGRFVTEATVDFFVSE